MVILHKNSPYTLVFQKIDTSIIKVANIIRKLILIRISLLNAKLVNLILVTINLLAIFIFLKKQVTVPTANFQPNYLKTTKKSVSSMASLITANFTPHLTQPPQLPQDVRNAKQVRHLLQPLPQPQPNSVFLTHF